VTFGGPTRPAWFDLHTLPPSNSERDNPPLYIQEQIISAVDHISALIDADIETVSGRVILVGFSQGGVMAIQTNLRGNNGFKIKGVAVLSGWMHDMERLCQHLCHAPTKDGREGGDVVAKEGTEGLGTSALHSAIFWGHGKADEEIPLSLGRDGVGWLQEVNGSIQLDFREYDGMGHVTCETEMRDLKAWLSHLLNPQSRSLEI
jgi:lysophospholipase-1